MPSKNPIDIATKHLGCTQTELAKRIGCSTGLVSMWKVRGYITQKYLEKACSVTGLPPSVLNPYIPSASACSSSQR